MPNVVYVLTNAAMPGILKIGKTDRPDVQDRMDELYTTGTPLPFECAVAWEFEGANAAEVEQAVHRLLDDHRINPNREFFRLDPEGLEVLLRTYPGRDVTPPEAGLSTESPSEDQAAVTEYKRQQRQTDKTEFLESLTPNGRLVYERVLALAEQDGMETRWGRKGFTLYSVASGTVVCRGYPLGTNRQRLHTESFNSLHQAFPLEVVDDIRTEALATELFEPMGQGDRLRCDTDRAWDEPQLTALTGWLSAVAERVHDGETFTTDESEHAL